MRCLGAEGVDRALSVSIVMEKEDRLGHNYLLDSIAAGSP
jgi:hypothetical protein